MIAADDRKMAELILYIADRAESDPHFGAVKLNKILFYSDFLFYARCGRSITNQEYMRLNQGPVPRRLVPIRDELIGTGAAVAKERYTAGGHWQKRTIAIRQPDLSEFSGEEIATVDSVIDLLWKSTAQDASELSHTFQGWKLADYKETIPYETVFLSKRKLTQAESEYARRFAE